MLASVALSIWLLQSQQHSNEQLLALQQKFEKLDQGVNSFAEVQNKVPQEQPGQKPEQLEQTTYDVLGKQLGIDPSTLHNQLPRFAQELKQAPNITAHQRANAAYVAKDYNEAERLALVAADQAQQGSPPNNGETIKAFELAGWSAEKRIEYADALSRLREAEKLTDRTRTPLEWARVQFAIAFVLYDQGQYRKPNAFFNAEARTASGRSSPLRTRPHGSGEAESGKRLAIFQGHTGAVISAVFSPDGRRVVTVASVGKTTRLWKVQSGKPLATFLRRLT